MFDKSSNKFSLYSDYSRIGLTLAENYKLLLRLSSDTIIELTDWNDHIKLYCSNAHVLLSITTSFINLKTLELNYEKGYSAYLTVATPLIETTIFYFEENSNIFNSNNCFFQYIIKISITAISRLQLLMCNPLKASFDYLIITLAYGSEYLFDDKIISDAISIVNSAVQYRDALSSLKKGIHALKFYYKISDITYAFFIVNDDLVEQNNNKLSLMNEYETFISCELIGDGNFSLDASEGLREASSYDEEFEIDNKLYAEAESMCNLEISQQSLCINGTVILDLIEFLYL